MAIELKYNTRLYKGTAAEFGASTRVWPENAILLTTDSGLIKIGDGESAYSALDALNTDGTVNYSAYQIRTASGWGSDSTKYAKGTLLVASDTGEARVTPLANKKWSEATVIVPPNMASIVLSAKADDVLSATTFAFVDGKFYLGDGETEFAELTPLVDTTEEEETPEE